MFMKTNEKQNNNHKEILAELDNVSKVFSNSCISTKCKLASSISICTFFGSKDPPSRVWLPLALITCFIPKVSYIVF